MLLKTTYDNFQINGPTATLPAITDRQQRVVDLGLDEDSLYRNIGVELTWNSSEDVALYEWHPSYLIKPENSLKRPTDWLDAGLTQYKFVHGCRITADTGGVERQVQVQYDGGQNGPLLTVNHDGELTLPYTFPPFKARLMRLVPLDAASWRLMTVEWVINPEPEPVSYWVTQPTTFDMPGFIHIRDFQFAYASTQAGGVLSMVVDGTNYILASNLPSSNGNEIKKYFAAPPVKGKLWQLFATGTALQVYLRDCEFRLKPWGASDYATVKPIGAETRTNEGARI